MIDSSAGGEQRRPDSLTGAAAIIKPAFWARPLETDAPAPQGS
ncbi:MAG: hypothetical protein ACRDOK_01410 [Streptosporangiaceae bacterium]